MAISQFVAWKRRVMPHTAPVSALFTAQNLHASAQGRSLFSGAELTLQGGEVVALLGPSGGGKSTLLRSIAGLVGDAASLEVGGVSVTQCGMPAWRRKVNYVPQTPTLAPLSVAENLRRVFRYQSATDPSVSGAPSQHDSSTSQDGSARSPSAGQHSATPQHSLAAPHVVSAKPELDEVAAKAQLERLGLPAAAWQRDALSLSVGEQQRVCLVRALCLSPSVLLLDEPTAALDAVSAARVEALVSEYVRERSAAALVVTHDAAQARRWATRWLTLQEGRLTKSLVPSELGSAPESVND